MYTWTLDLYIQIIKILFVILPFIIFFINKQKIKKLKNYQVIIASFTLFVILTLSLLMIREYQIDKICDICLDEITRYNYKDTVIPQGCYSFDINKYMGVGWPLTAIFLIVYNFVYHIGIYFIWQLISFFKNRNKFN